MIVRLNAGIVHADIRKDLLKNHSRIKIEYSSSSENYGARSRSAMPTIAMSNLNSLIHIESVFVSIVVLSNKLSKFRN